MDLTTFSLSIGMPGLKKRAGNGGNEMVFGNVKALMEYDIRELEKAREIVGNMPECNSTNNVVEKLGKVLAARRNLTIFKHKSGPLYFICPTREILNHYISNACPFEEFGIVNPTQLKRFSVIGSGRR